MQAKFSSLRNSEKELLTYINTSHHILGQSQEINADVSSDELKTQKDLIKKGYQRVHEKIKEFRQNFQNILAGRRSGGVKISDWYYEDLLRIWGGSPYVEALPFVHH